MNPTFLALTALERRLTIRFVNLPDEAVDAFALAWRRCGAERSTDPGDGPSGLTAVLGEAGPDAASSGAAEPTLAAPTVEELFARISSWVTTHVIGLRRRDLMLLHAGAVADPATGRTIALVGPSGAGKTTAVRRLAASYGYVTDETVAVRDDLRVVPYPKPLSVIDGDAMWKRSESPDDAGLLCADDADARLVGVLLLDRVPEGSGDAEAVVASVPFHRGIGALVEQISYLPERSGALQRLKWAMDACGGIRRVTYSRAEQLAGVVRGLLDAPSTTVAPFVPRAQLDHDHAALAVPPRPAPGGEVGYARQAGVDSVSDGEQRVVLTAGRVLVLDGIAPSIWDVCVEPRTFDDILAAVLSAHPDSPPGATNVVFEAVENLVAVGALRSLA